MLMRGEKWQIGDGETGRSVFFFKSVKYAGGNDPLERKIDDMQR